MVKAKKTKTKSEPEQSQGKAGLPAYILYKGDRIKVTLADMLKAADAADAKAKELRAKAAIMEVQEKGLTDLQLAHDDIKAAILDILTKRTIPVDSLYGKVLVFGKGETGLLVSLEVAKKTTTPKASNGTPKANDTPKAPKAGDGIEYEYTLQDGRGPFADVQSALDASGVDKAQRPKHNRYDRLSAVWQAKIIRKVKGSTEAGKAGTTEATEAGITEATEAGTNGKGTTSEAIELVASAK